MSPTNAINIQIRLLAEDIQQLRHKDNKKIANKRCNTGVKRIGKNKGDQKDENEVAVNCMSKNVILRA